MKLYNDQPDEEASLPELATDGRLAIHNRCGRRVRATITVKLVESRLVVRFYRLQRGHGLEAVEGTTEHAPWA